MFREVIVSANTPVLVPDRDWLWRIDAARTDIPRI
jgi:hypothetical protein